MVNRYEEAAREVEAQIKKLEERAVRFEAHATLHTRAPGVRAEIERLRTLPLDKWRSTGNWAKEIWG